MQTLHTQRNSKSLRTYPCLCNMGCDDGHCRLLQDSGSVSASCALKHHMMIPPPQPMLMDAVNNFMSARLHSDRCVILSTLRHIPPNLGQSDPFLIVWREKQLLVVIKVYIEEKTTYKYPNTSYAVLMFCAPGGSRHLCALCMKHGKLGLKHRN